MMVRAHSAATPPLGTAVLMAALLLATSATAAEDMQTASTEPGANRHLERLIQYVRWPDEQYVPHPWRICVIGDATPIARHFNGVHARQRQIIVTSPDAPDGAGNCDLLDLRRVEGSAQQAWIDAVRGKPVLTFGHEPVFCARGGHSCFTQQGPHPFEVNLSATQTSGLRVNARLLAPEHENVVHIDRAR